MYLENLTITHTSPCTADETQMKIRAATSASLQELLPYLNAELKDPYFPFYYPDGGYIQIKKGYKLICLYDSMVTITKLNNITEAHHELDLVKDIINDVYSRKDSITPNHEGKKMPPAIQIFKNLPKTNCKKCGENTCMSFAAKLNTFQANISQCPEIFKDEYKDKLEALEAIM